MRLFPDLKKMTCFSKKKNFVMFLVRCDFPGTKSFNQLMHIKFHQCFRRYFEVKVFRFHQLKVTISEIMFLQNPPYVTRITTLAKLLQEFLKDLARKSIFRNNLLISFSAQNVAKKCMNFTNFLQKLHFLPQNKFNGWEKNDLNAKKDTNVPPH